MNLGATTLTKPSFLAHRVTIGRLSERECGATTRFQLFDLRVKAGAPRSRTFSTALVEAFLPNCEATTVLHETHGCHHSCWSHGSMHSSRTLRVSRASPYPKSITGESWVLALVLCSCIRCMLLSNRRFDVCTCAHQANLPICDSAMGGCEASGAVQNF